MEKRLSQLKSIIFGSQQCLKSYAIWRLYLSVIDPIWLTNIEIYSNNMQQINKQLKPLYREAMWLVFGQKYIRPNLLDLYNTQHYGEHN